MSANWALPGLTSDRGPVLERREKLRAVEKVDFAALRIHGRCATGSVVVEFHDPATLKHNCAAARARILEKFSPATLRVARFIDYCAGGRSATIQELQ